VTVREPDAVLDCIDCGGPASLVSEAPELGWAPGEGAYSRARDCLDRWDVVVEEEG
jgi:hypothetical protein